CARQGSPYCTTTSCYPSAFDLW
nr:immunoglobulin heavy chain junction region [Macaca mulatta]